MDLSNATAGLLNAMITSGENAMSSPTTRPHLVHRANPPACFYAGVAAVGPSQLFQTLEERCEIGFPEVRCRGPHEDGDPPHFT
jgi:hypothetical protein